MDGQIEGIAGVFEVAFGEIMHGGDVANECQTVSEDGLSAAAADRKRDVEHFLAFERGGVHVGDIVRDDIHLSFELSLARQGDDRGIFHVSTVP